MIEYNWNRHWRKRDSELNIDSDGLLRETSNNFCTFLDIEHENLLILLGDPGIGKSRTLQSEYIRIQEKYNALFINLRDYENLDWLKNKVTQTLEYQYWENSNHETRLYIFLDALDEMLVRSKASLNEVIGYLHSLNKSNLYLRITCRSAEWPDFINAKLEAFNERNFLRNRYLKDSTDLNDENLIVLLNDSSFSRSTELKEDYIKTTKSNKAILINLREYKDLATLKEQLISNDDYKKSLENQKTEKFYIYLDGIEYFDKQSQSEFIDFLRSILQPYTFLRMACNPSHWHDRYHQQISELYGINSIDLQERSIFTLCPLTFEQINEALLHDSNKSINKDFFWKEVQQHKLSSLVTHPYTLEMLLKVYKEGSKSITSKDQLFENCIETLAREHNKTRSFYNSNKLSSSELIEIAQILALISVISGELNIDYTDNDCRDGYLNLLKLYPKLQLKYPKITLTSLDTVLKSGIFMNIGENLYTWSHKINAEYLAATAIINENIDIQILMELFTIRLKDYISISRGFLGIISWLLDKRKDFLNVIIEHEPEVLFELGFNIPVDSRKKVLENIFRKIAITDYNTRLKIHSKYKTLYFEGIENILQDKLQNSLSKDEKIETLKIISDCNLSMLSPIIKSMLSNETNNGVLKEAVTTLLQLSTDDEKRDALNYLKLPDPDDKIKAAVLKTLWPKFINFKELLENLKEPENDGYIGSYKALLYDLKNREFTNEDKLYFIDYVLQNDTKKSDYYKDSNLNAICHQLYISSLELVKFNKYKISVFKFIQSMITNPEKLGFRIYQYISILETSYKRELILYLLKENTSLDFNYHRILTVDDIEWGLEVLLQHNNGREFLIKLLNLYSYEVYDDTLLISKVIRFIQQYNIKCDVFKDWPLEDFRVQRYKKTYKKTLEADLVDISTIEHLIKNAEQKNLDAWVALLHSLSSNDSFSIQNIRLSLKNIPAILKEKIIKICKINLKTDFDIPKYLLKEQWSNYEIGLFYIFNIVYENEQEYIFNLSKETLKGWLVFFAKVITFNPDTEEDRRIEILDLLSKKMPNVANEIIRMNIDVLKFLENSSHYRLIEYIKNYGNEETFSHLKKLLCQKELKDKLLLGDLCNVLIAKNDTDTIEFLKQEISQSAVDEHAFIYAKSLLIHRKEWDFIFSKMKEDTLFRKKCLLILAESNKHDFLAAISSKYYVELYKMLENCYPEEKYKTEPRNTGYWGSENEIYFFKNALLNSLIDAGTNSSYHDLEVLKEEFPLFDYWHFILKHARSTYFTKNSSNIAAAIFLEMLIHTDSRIINTEEDLIKILLNVLDKVQQDLIGENSEVFLLWLPMNNKYVKPRNENEFSTFLMNRMKAYVERYSMILNREVEWRPSKKSFPGERTDIHVNAISPNGDKITAIIEVKGNWHTDLKKAMKEQLAERYLTNSSTRSGIYLVAWFESNWWSKEDSRLQKRPFKKLLDATEFFNAQATILNNKNYYIKPYVMKLPY